MPRVPGRFPKSAFWAKGMSKMEVGILLGAYKGIRAWGQLIAQRARTGGRIPVATGHMARNIRAGTAKLENPPAGFSILIGTGTEVPYTRAQEMGSGLFAEFGEKKKIEIWAGRLNPKGSKSLSPKFALAFAWPGGPTAHPAYNEKTGKFVFAKIMHPGVKPKRFLRGAAEDTEEEGKRLFMSAVKAEMQRAQ